MRARDGVQKSSAHTPCSDHTLFCFAVCLAFLQKYLDCQQHQSSVWLRICEKPPEKGEGRRVLCIVSLRTSAAETILLFSGQMVSYLGHMQLVTQTLCASGQTWHNHKIRDKQPQKFCTLIINAIATWGTPNFATPFSREELTGSAIYSHAFFPNNTLNTACSIAFVRGMFFIFKLNFIY